MAITDGDFVDPDDPRDDVDADGPSRPIKTTVGKGSDKSEVPDIDPADEELVKKWHERLKDARAHAKKAFKRMKDNEYLATHGGTRDWIAGKNYTVAIVNRHINQAVASLYARDPVAQAKPRDKMRYTIWDGRQDTLQSALQLLPLGDPQARAIVEDVMQARQVEQLVKKTGRTIEILWKYFTAEQANGFKQQFKALVRRTKVCGVGYVKLAFQRALEPRPEISAQIEDATSMLATTERLLKESKDEEFDKFSAKAAELRSLLEDLRDREYLVIREGPVFDFPKAYHVLIDPNCTHLKTFAGARWVAQQFDLDNDEIREIYGIDLAAAGAGATDEGDGLPVNETVSAYDSVVQPKKELIKKRRVYEIQDKRDCQFLTICEGYKGFLKAPDEPDVKVDRFFTLFPLVFNEIESDEELYPPSDVELLQDTQSEYNRARQGLREHRQANRPKYATAKGALSDEDIAKLAVHPAHAVLELAALKIGDDVSKLIQRLPMIGIDPNQYSTQDFFSDIERVVGTQQANLGTGSNTTATETSIVEQGRQAGIGDNLDDLDDLLSALALATGQLLMLEMSVDMVKQIVGPGAVWPDAPPSRQEISENVLLDVKAGSTGRPNRAVELANIERALPFFLQVPGTSLVTLRDRIAILLDLDPEELVADGAPSMTALNAMMVKAQMGGPVAGSPGGPGAPPPQPGAPGLPPNGAGAGAPRNPAMQGHAGGMNAPAPHMPTPGPRPGMPAQTLPPVR